MGSNQHKLWGKHEFIDKIYGFKDEFGWEVINTNCGVILGNVIVTSTYHTKLITNYLKVKCELKSSDTMRSVLIGNCWETY